MKLVIVATNLNRPELWKRWLLLKNDFCDIDITILAPKRYEDGGKKGYTFGGKIIFEGSEYVEERFKVRPIKVKQNKLGGWSSPDLNPYILEECPDFIYYIGVHASEALLQVIYAAKRVKAQVLVFTMRGDLKKKKGKTVKHFLISVYSQLLSNHNVHHSDAIFVHYPDAITAFRKEGYKGPMYINTQIGVDTSHFQFSKEGRDRIRKKFGLETCFVLAELQDLMQKKVF